MNKDLKIYAISGKAQHGKDTFAELLYQELTDKGYKVLVTHYGDLVKYICKTIFNWDGQKDEKGRHLLQYVGTDIIRKEKPDYWVDFVVDIIKFFGENWDYVLIPDTRFPNEIDVLKENFSDVKYIRVTRPNFESTLTDEQKRHPSETALDDVWPDVKVINSGTIDALKIFTKAFVENELNYA
jgi:hypothetical protein